MEEIKTPYMIFGRWLIWLALAAVSVAYDISVAEISGDLRWMLIHATALVLAAGYFLSCPDMAGIRIGRQPPLIIWLTLFLVGWSAVSMLWTINPYHTWWVFKHLAGYTAFFIFIYVLRDERWYGRLLWVIAAGMGFNCLIGIAQFHNLGDADVIKVFPLWHYVAMAFSALLRFGSAWDGTDRAVAGTLPFFHTEMLLDLFRQTAPPAGTLANRNLLGSYLVVTLPGVVYLTLAGRSAIRRIIAALLLGVGLITLVYTRSRASWLAALITLIFFAGWLVFRQRQWGMVKSFFSRPLLLGLAAMGLAIVIGGSLRGGIGLPSIIERCRTLARMPLDTDRNNTVGIRMAYNLNGMAMIRDRPWLGVGLGAFQAAYPAYHQAVCPTPSGGFSVYERPSRMHNDLGQVFVELGIFGGLACIGIFLSLLWMAWQLGAKTQSRETSLMSLCLMAGIFGLSINALADFPLQLPLSPTILWCYAGMLTGMYVTHARPIADGLASVTERKRVMPRWLGVTLAMLAMAGCCFVCRDDRARRSGAQYLKGAMALANAGRFDEQTLLLLRKSMAHYAWNVRLQEYRALIFANYRGTNIHVSTDGKIREVAAATKYDPYSPHKLINLGGLYIIKAYELVAVQENTEALEYARKAEAVFGSMLNYPTFFADRTYALGGLANMLQGAMEPVEALPRLRKAQELLQKALEINPDHTAAREALKRIEGIKGL